MGRLMPRIVALPACLFAVVTVAWLGLAAANLDPFWAQGAVTLSEAAASGDAGELVRLLGEGHDPNGRYPVRAGLLAGRTLIVTPLEAATRAARPEIEALLVRAGATRLSSSGSPQ